jgi:muramidase (phage lysozyme)
MAGEMAIQVIGTGNFQIKPKQDGVEITVESPNTLGQNGSARPSVASNNGANNAGFLNGGSAVASAGNLQPFAQPSSVGNTPGSSLPKADLAGLTPKGKECVEALKMPKVKAALEAIAIAEHGKDVALSKEGGYNTSFGGSTFSEFTDHPRKLVSSGGLSSDAAGRYQFLSTTWDGVKTELGLKDFTTESQDIAAVGLLQNRGVLSSIMDGKFEQSLGKLGEEWASIEGNPYGQGTDEGKISNITANYQKALASLEGNNSNPSSAGSKPPSINSLV